MAKKKIQFQPGDIFCFPLTETEYGFGRILLDIDSGAKSGKIPAGSSLVFGQKGSILVELYAQTSGQKEFDPSNTQVLVPGLFTTNVLIEIFKWEIVDHKEVTPSELDFPESFSPQGSRKAKYVKGEIGFEVPMRFAEVEKIKVLKTQVGASAIPGIILYMLDRKEEIRIPKKELRNPGRFDLRFAPSRDQIYALLPDELKGSYHEVATNQGVDPARLL